MNRNTLEAYAQKARRNFIAAVTARAAFYGLTARSMEPVVEEGDVTVIGAHAFPRTVAKPRKCLEEQIRRDGFERVMETMAYTWFNRLAAIRYMELHGYLDHGYRVLSHPEGQPYPEILEHADDVDLPDLDREKAVELKLDGSKDEELYRLLLKAQCNALHQAMPFLFERSDEDAIGLLLPANLLHTDSLIRQLVEAIDESAWSQIEIIGWLYQFYISEKKAQVIGKVVASVDIPAATQLFTPNWIVKYMVQNSLGAQWLATYPHSSIKGQMDYHIEPAEQTDEVTAQLAAITPGTLNPEALTLIDPASGSGHILVEAYDLFKAIYLERGYQKRGVAQLILEKNLFGLDIDGRAAQLTGFALMMKGRADDRRLFERGVKLNVMALVDSTGFDAERLAQTVKLGDYKLAASDLLELKRLFEHATTFGSLIQVPERLAAKLPGLKQLSETTSQDLFVSDALKRLGLLVRQAEFLATQYDAVVANPPYMGSKFYCAALKKFMNSFYKAGKADLYASFTLRNIQFSKKLGHVGMIAIPNWMFLSSFNQLRDTIFRSAPITSLVHNGRGVWGSDFGSCSYVLMRSSPCGFNGRFLRLFDKQGSVASNEELERRFHTNPRFSTSNIEFKKIPGSPVAYWVSANTFEAFKHDKLSDNGKTRRGLQTGDRDCFIRTWQECAINRIERRLLTRKASLGSSAKWFLFNNGGDFRKWYGNLSLVVEWEANGLVLKEFPGSIIPNEDLYFSPGVCWSRLTSAIVAFRLHPGGVIPGDLSPCLYAQNDLRIMLAYLNSAIARHFMRVINPTLTMPVGDVAKIPYLSSGLSSQTLLVSTKRLLAEHKTDWDAYERSWDFESLPILTASSDVAPTLESSYTARITQNREAIAEMRRLEEKNNRLFIDAYGLTDELTPDVPIEQITLTVNPAYRYGGKLTEEEQWTRFRKDTMAELVSYAIGCMMGRYSLDEPGLIYAHSGNVGFDASGYTTFPADPDGIVPLTDSDWFDDDAAHRLIEFISMAWDAARLEANLAFLANNLSPKKNESSRETLRRYLCDSFFKDHLQTYKKRPIYWLFSSGKQKAFQCLVNLHRYNEGTLARMRTEYVIPLQGMMASRVRQLEGDIAVAASTTHRRRLEKERETLVKQQSELREFDEKLRHYADQRIGLDLDDGVKVNYGKFGDLLAEVKAITGAKAD